jgi:SAM-dependent methyltransferase
MIDRLARDAYDRIASIYEWDMARNMPFDDAAYYVRHAREDGGPALELGCGSGRIALALARAGVPTVAADVSGNMLAELQRAARALPESVRGRLRALQMDVRAWALRARFATILMPYSLIAYIVEPAPLSALLGELRGSLRAGGRLIVDAFIPRAGLPLGESIADYRRELPGGRTLERSKLIEATEDSAVRLIRRTYRLSGSEPFTTTSRLRLRHPGEIAALLREGGFQMEGIDFDYGQSRQESAAQFATLRARARTASRTSPASPR